MPTRHAFALAIAALSLTTIAGCERESPREEMPPVVVRGVLTLTATQQAKLGLSVEKAAVRDVAPDRVLPGVVALRPEDRLVVKAPVTGFASPLPDGALLGAMVSTDKPVGNVKVVLSPQEEAQLVAAREEADTAIRQSELSMRLAKTQMDRLSSADGVVAQTRLEELADTYEKARASLEEAKQKLPYLPKEGSGHDLALRSVEVTTPLGGLVAEEFVRPGQFVLQGDPLWTVEDRSKVWVRVGVYDSDLPRVAWDETVDVSMPGAKAKSSGRPVVLPLANRPNSRYVELTYEVDNADAKLRPGQTVSVRVPLSGKTRAVVVPTSAVLLDGRDAAWVYMRTVQGEFRRRRVELGAYLADGVVVERGLAAGDSIVVVGAQSLYGEEFKTDIQIEENEAEEEEERERERKRG